MAVRNRSPSNSPRLESDGNFQSRKGRRPTSSPRMEMTQNVAAWLAWLSRVRFFLITLLLTLVLVLGKTSQLEVSTRFFIPLMILWYTLAIVYTILIRWMPVASWHGPVQMVFDLIFVT